MGDRHEREKPLDALEQIFPQRHFQRSMKETTRRTSRGCSQTVTGSGSQERGQPCPRADSS